MLFEESLDQWHVLVAEFRAHSNDHTHVELVFNLAHFGACNRHVVFWSETSIQCTWRNNLRVVNAVNPKVLWLKFTKLLIFVISSTCV